MGCGVSGLKKGGKEKDVIPVLTQYSSTASYPRETRIIQEEEVDVCVDDEYDSYDTEWPQLLNSFKLIEIYGEWIIGETAGGSRNDLELFAMNPQYLLTVGPPEKHPTKDDYLFPRQKSCDAIEVTVSLTQLGEPPLLHIAFFIYETDTKDEKLSAEYFLCVQPEQTSGAFINWRQIRHQFRLSPGIYVVIPAIFKPHLSGKFNLTVYSMPPVSLQPILPDYNFSAVGI